MWDERQDGDRLLRTQTVKASCWCSKWIPNLPKQCCIQAGKLCPEAPGPSCLCGASHSLTDGHSTVWPTFPLVSCLLLGFCGVWKYSAFQPPSFHLLFVWGLCNPYIHGGTMDSSTSFHNFQEMNSSTALFFCQTWSKLAREFRVYRGWGHPTGRQTHRINRFLPAS